MQSIQATQCLSSNTLICCMVQTLLKCGRNIHFFFVCQLYLNALIVSINICIHTLRVKCSWNNPSPHEIVYGIHGPERGSSVDRTSDFGARRRRLETYLRHVVSFTKTLYSPRVLVIPGKPWLRPEMTEKLMNWTLSPNTNKQTKFIAKKFIAKEVLVSLA